MNGDYAALPLGELMERVAAPTPSPGGGSLAALSVGLAASLVAMVARSSHDSWPDAGGIAAQALELAARCPDLARDDAVVWEEAFDELRVAAENDGAGGNGNLPALLDLSAALPLEIAEIGADVAILASLAAKLGDGSLRADAASAAVLAYSGARRRGSPCRGTSVFRTETTGVSGRRRQSGGPGWRWGTRSRPAR